VSELEARGFLNPKQEKQKPSIKNLRPEKAMKIQIPIVSLQFIKLLHTKLGYRYKGLLTVSAWKERKKDRKEEIRE
jgi:hypothetical protein